MHAVVVKVTVENVEKAQELLQSRVVPAVSQAPGFVAGYWTRAGNGGLSMLVFDSEDGARQWADQVPQMAPEFVTVDSVEVREVVASA